MNEVGGGRAASLRAYGLCGCAALSILLILETWRTRFFLTDDSFSLVYPIWVEASRHLWTQDNPFVSQYIFGGGYNLLADTHFNMLWHPIPLLLSPLALSPVADRMVDIYCGINLLLAATGFLYLCRRMSATIPNGFGLHLQIFIALSYAFSMYALLLGSSGFWYLTNMAAAPWLLGIVFDLRWRRAFLIGALLHYHNAVGGYPSCFIFSTGLLSMFACARAVASRSWRPVLVFFGSGVFAAVWALPSVMPSVLALGDSVRSGAIPPGIASENSMPPLVLMASFLMGPASHWLGEFELFGHKAHAYALASAAAAPLALAAFWNNRRFKAWESTVLAAIGLSVLLVWRPSPLAMLFSHVPFVKSLRWPHKEIYLFVLFAHLWMLRGTLASFRMRTLLCLTGIVVFVAPLVRFGPPSLGAHRISRRLYFSGQAEAFWQNFKRRCGSEAMAVPVSPTSLLDDIPTYRGLPQIVSGAENFPALFGVRTWTGYSLTLPRTVMEREPRSHMVYGNVAEENEGLSRLKSAVAIRTVCDSDRRVITLTYRGWDGREWSENFAFEKSR